MALTLPMTFPTARRFSAPGHDEDYDLSNPIELDMSEYQARLQRQRDETCLYLRRLATPGMKKILNARQQQQQQQYFIENPNNNINNNIPNIQLFIEILNSADSVRITNFLNTVPRFDTQIISHIAANDEIVECLTNAISNGQSLTSDALTLLISIVSAVFPYGNENVQRKIADDISFALVDLLNNDETVKVMPLCSAVLNLVTVFSQESIYARNTITCLGIHTYVIEIASKSESDELVELCLITVFSIFRNEGEMEENVIIDSIDPLFQLLNGNSEQNVCLILNIFSIITKKLPDYTIPMFYQKNLYDTILMHYVNVPQLVNVSLSLFANMCLSLSPKYIIEILNNGLFEKLMILVQSPDYAANVYSVLSSLLRAVEDIMIHLISFDFITASAHLAESTSSEIKKNVAFFISTFIIVSKNIQSRIGEIANEQIIELIAELLDCGIEEYIRISVDAFFKILISAYNAGQLPLFITIFENCGIGDQLEEISLQSNGSVIADKVSKLISMIDKYSQGNA